MLTHSCSSATNGYTWGNWLHDWCNTVFCALPITKYHINKPNNLDINNRP